MILRGMLLLLVRSLPTIALAVVAVAVRLQSSLAQAGAAAPVSGTAPGVFRGHFASGFERSTFVPCPGPGVPSPLEVIRRDSAWYLPAAVWLSVDERARARMAPLPRVPLRDGSTYVWYVVWRGTFSAPGHHGHAGVSRYEFVVDSILEARAPAPGDCEPAKRMNGRTHGERVDRRHR